MNNKNKKKSVKALILFSGGLDSRLAVKLLQEQNIEVEAVHFLLPFGGGCCNNFSCVFNYSQIQGVKLRVIDFNKSPYFEEYLEFIKNPKFGTGTAINPCKDCKIYMLKKAKQLADAIKADFIVTGEVLGQRPMSQLKKDLILTEKESGLTGKLLRPLSAKLLPETDAEKKGLINRSKLLDIKGRSRKEQIKLAKKHKIKYPDSGGGCLLCEKIYAKKLKDLFKNKELNKQKIIPEEIEALNLGRHFRTKNGKIILGKNKIENEKLEFLNKKLKFHIIIPKTPGPTAVFESIKDTRLINSMISVYSSNNLELRRKYDKYNICSIL